MGSDRRLLRVRSEAYVYAEVDPQDLQASAGNIMKRLASFRSFTYLHPFEEVNAEEVPPVVQEHFQAGSVGVYAAVPEQGDEEEAEPVRLRFHGGGPPSPGEWLCRLPSATYVMVDVPMEDVEDTWRSLKEQLGGPQALSLAEPDVDVLPLEQAPEDVYLWVLYGAADRVVVPLWPEDQIERPEQMLAWREAPARLESREPYRGAYVRVVAVHPPQFRGMICRKWHLRRDEKPGIGTVRGKYPVDVAVSVPSEKRTPHIHSFDSISARDWRPGLVFYSQTDEDGCPVSSLGRRLEEYTAPRQWVPEGTWRAWLEDEG